MGGREGGDKGKGEREVAREETEEKGARKEGDREGRRKGGREYARATVKHATRFRFRTPLKASRPPGVRAGLDPADQVLVRMHASAALLARSKLTCACASYRINLALVQIARRPLA